MTIWRLSGDSIARLTHAGSLKSHWPPNLPTPDSMTPENLISSWFIYKPQTQDIELGKAWHMQPGGALTSFEWYWELYKDTPGVDDTPEESMIGGPPTPRIRYSYDIYGDGKFIIHGKAVAYEQADVFTVTLGTRIDF